MERGRGLRKAEVGLGEMGEEVSCEDERRKLAWQRGS